MGLSEYGYPSFLSFKVEGLRTCATSSGYVTDFGNVLELPFQFVSIEGNSLYSHGYWLNGPGNTDIQPVECFYDMRAVCCGLGSINSVLSWSLSHVETTSNETTSSVSVSLDIGGSFSYPGNFQLPVNFGSQIIGEYTVSKTYIDQISFESGSEFSYNYEINAPEDGTCVVPGIAVQYKAFKVDTYQPNCNGTDMLVSSETIWVPRYLEITSCSGGQPPSGCDPISPPIIDKGINGNLIAGNLNCEGYISMQFSDGATGLSISWTGSDGFTSDEFNLSELEVGTYHYTIYNECCDELTGSVVLCDNDEIEHGPWEFNSSTNEYCRILSCVGDVGDFITQGKVNNCETVECILPDQIETYHNGINCIEQHFYQGELLGEYIVESYNMEILYDEASNACRKTILCNDTPVNNFSELPTYGGWNYDSFTERCTRATFCFGQQMIGQDDTKEPEIVEEYNPINGLCEKIVYCDGVPFQQPPSFPILNGQWSWDAWNGCTRQVQCDINSEITIVTGNTSFLNWSFNNNNGLCEAAVACDNQFVPGVIYSESPNGYGNWDWSNSGPYGFTCQRMVYCSINNIAYTQYAPAEWVPTSIPCPWPYEQFNVGYLYCGGEPTNYTDCVNPLTNEPIEDRFFDDGAYSGLSVSEGEYQYLISPNPFNSSIVFSNSFFKSDEPLVFEILDITGREVLSGLVESRSINVSDLVNGVYVIQVLDLLGKKVYSQKLVKL